MDGLTIVKFLDLQYFPDVRCKQIPAILNFHALLPYKLFEMLLICFFRLIVFKNIFLFLAFNINFINVYKIIKVLMNSYIFL